MKNADGKSGLAPAWRELLARHIALPHEHHCLSWGDDFHGLMAKNAGQRDGEVALAVRRPDGLLLLHTKPFYPPATWRIPTGGIERGERIGEAALREMAEETGLPAGEAELLGVLTYEVCASKGRPVHFATAVFLFPVPDLPPARQDPQEQISGYRWVPPGDLPAIATHLEHLPPDWADWGRFRALAHRFVARVLL